MNSFNQINDKETREAFSKFFDIALSSRRKTTSVKVLAKNLDIPEGILEAFEKKELFDYDLFIKYCRINNVEIGFYLKNQ